MHNKPKTLVHTHKDPQRISFNKQANLPPHCSVNLAIAVWRQAKLN